MTTISDIILFELRAALRLHNSGYADDKIPEHWRPVLQELERRGVVELRDGDWVLIKTPKKGHDSMNLKSKKLDITIHSAFAVHVAIHNIDKKGLHGKLVLIDGEVVLSETACKFVVGPRTDDDGLERYDIRLLGKHAEKVARLVGAYTMAQVADQLTSIDEMMTAAWEQGQDS